MAKIVEDVFVKVFGDIGGSDDVEYFFFRELIGGV